MKKTTGKWMRLFVIFFLVSVLFTVGVKYVDVEAIGPHFSKVGFATLNSFAAARLPLNREFFQISQYMGIAALVTIFLFALDGFFKMLKKKLDRRTVILGFFYLLLLIVYLVFEKFIVINYRPVILKNGVLSPSYPSSHVMLAVFVFFTGAYQMAWMCKIKFFGFLLGMIMFAAGCFMIFTRVLSGVHWITDIIAGYLFASTLVCLYAAVVCASGKSEVSSEDSAPATLPSSQGENE
ncbi:MAG: phosphatase PAP2 family protein [Sphaerochaetaceae bacterium]|nr:phosphatase PAP2 family protein [Sphaerochaetaceae bacterium]